MLEKIKTIGQLGQIASEARANGRKVVLAHGVFDILHVGHKRHLDIGKHLLNGRRGSHDFLKVQLALQFLLKVDIFTLQLLQHFLRLFPLSDVAQDQREQPAG